jgi:hypothetical protein
MKICFGFLVTLLCLAWSGGAWPQVRQARPEQSAPSEISLTEAEILIYVLPQSQAVRKQRGGISWELEEGPARNTKDFFTFWVVGPLREGEASSTVGFFSVNKHTADVWNGVTSKLISDDELSGIQKILRDGHHIDVQTIERYRKQGP